MAVSVSAILLTGPILIADGGLSATGGSPGHRGGRHGDMTKTPSRAGKVRFEWRLRLYAVDAGLAPP